MTKSTPYTQSGRALQTQHDTGPRAQTAAHNSFLQARIRQIGNWVTQGVKPEALVRFALLDLSTNDKLRACTPESIYLALLACAVTGLEPGALKGEAYLVPFGGKAQFMPGWRGLVKQARRSREILGMAANVVREADTFDTDMGTANSLVHKPARNNRGEVIGAYAIATMSGGHHEIEWLDRDDLDAIQKVAESRGRSPAWKDWEDQMQRKSAIRRLAKRLPLGADYHVGLALERAADEGREQKDVLDMMAESGASTDSGADRAPQIVEPAFDPTADVDPS
jgi:recombination protein RecT